MKLSVTHTLSVRKRAHNKINPPDRYAPGDFIVIRRNKMNIILRKSGILIVLLMLITAQPVFAECWVVSGLKGYESKAADNYNTHESAYSGQQFRITINGKKSSVTGWEPMTFEEITPQLIVGVYKSGGYKGQVDTFGIDIEHGKVFYTQTKSGYSIFDGTKMFIGKLEGKCK